MNKTCNALAALAALATASALAADVYYLRVHKGTDNILTITEK